LGYTYPGGPIIEELALTGKPTYHLPLTKLDNSMDFSFSGLKTAARLLIEKEGSELNANDLAASLQFTLARILVFKINKALSEKQVNTFVLGGGVTANQYLVNYLKKYITQRKEKIDIFIPSQKYCTDNAAMIGMLAYYSLISKLRKKNELWIR